LGNRALGSSLARGTGGPLR